MIKNGLKSSFTLQYDAFGKGQMLLLIMKWPHLAILMEQFSTKYSYLISCQGLYEMIDRNHSYLAADYEATANSWLA